ncbi:hypothetical protein LX83_006029 [Goodfellowiella coeruleoviolacea]|uniref:Uncharacterized protein n=1 Tax=Goodfellowiella coeruleoviolacea TaxID=334858 RepID=A0AAE3KJ31_9PSEU|nr:hypothetical protein [Goodfellowiella coeruleoviolacea]
MDRKLVDTAVCAVLGNPCRPSRPGRQGGAGYDQAPVAAARVT